MQLINHRKVTFNRGYLMELNKKSMALALGIVCGAWLFLLTLGVMVLGKTEGLACIQSVYPGYSVSILGAFVGMAYAFADGLIGGYLFAWLYNKLIPKG